MINKDKFRKNYDKNKPVVANIKIIHDEVTQVENSITGKINGFQEEVKELMKILEESQYHHKIIIDNLK